MYGTKQIYPQLNNPLLFRLRRIKEIGDFFITEFNQGKKNEQKVLHKYIAALDYSDKALLVLLSAISVVSVCSFATVLGILVNIASDSGVVSTNVSCFEVL